jgi:hypothetical protein
VATKSAPGAGFGSDLLDVREQESRRFAQVYHGGRYLVISIISTSFANTGSEQTIMSPPQSIASLRMRDATQSEPIQTDDQPAITSPTRLTSAMETAHNTTSSLAAVSEGAARASNNGISTATKVGLGMIPIIVVSVGLWILFLFWYRRRRAARKATRQSIAPSVPDKDVSSYCPSIDSARRTSKVFQMTAFSTPVHDGRYREAQMFGDRQVDEGASMGERTKINMDSAPLRSPHMAEVDLDSPIDGSSPFRLKRGDTVKRNSLGPALAQLWPSPPSTACIKPSADDELPAPVVRRESSVYHLYPGRSIR